MKKGDKQFDVGYGQGGGGGMGGAYRGPSSGMGGGGAYGGKMERAYQAQANQKIEIPKSAIRNDRIDKPMGAAAIGMGAAAGAGVLAKKRKEAKKMEEYRRKPRMADGPPKINLRKAYEE